MDMKKLGSCGETDERVAAKMHGVVGLLYSVLFVLEGIMIWWHFSSVKTHLDRAKEQNEP